jgi:NADPH-dependent 2,4-dienoyl-CoA reductase/sulfur reductase-like enzyme
MPGCSSTTTMQTSVAGIYAAGDVAEAVEFGTGLRVVNAIQPDAVEQARIAALNMAGQSAALPGTFVFNILDTLGLISASFGQWQGIAGGKPRNCSTKPGFVTCAWRLTVIGWSAPIASAIPSTSGYCVD